MLTSQDIKLMQAVFPTKEEVVSLTEFLGLKEDIRSLQTSVDNLAKMVKEFRDEHLLMHHRLEKLETWAKKVSAQTGIPLPY